MQGVTNAAFVVDSSDPTKKSRTATIDISTVTVGSVQHSDGKV